MDEETDFELLALQGMFEGSRMTQTALALVMLDAGLIKKERLLAIIESLHGVLAADFVGRLGSIEDAQLALDNLAAWIDGFEWREGHVLETLRAVETTEFLRAQKRLKREP